MHRTMCIVLPQAQRLSPQLFTLMMSVRNRLRKVSSAASPVVMVTNVREVVVTLYGHDGK